MFNQANSKKSFYEILDLNKDATIDEIKESYARAKSTYSEENPALYGMVSGNEREDTLSQIEEAFRILSNADTRQAYDRQENGINNLDSLDPNSKNFNRPEGFTIRTEQAPATETIKAKPAPDGFEKQSIKKLIENNKYQLDFDIDETFEKNIRDATLFSGEFLKEIREYKKVSVEKMSEMTRISKTNIKNIEAENTDPLPATVYVRGFVYQYAKCLKLNPELVASSYMHQLKKKQENV